MSRRHAFTLVEVLVVISIIALLISMLMPSLAQGKRNARMAVCLSGLHQLGVAWTSYTDDSMGVLVGASTGRPKYDWVYTVPPPSMPTNETEDNLKAGTLYNYIRDTNLYRCPDDPRTTYVRSYSMSNYPGGMPGWGVVAATKQHQLHKQDRTLLFVEEPDPRGYNWGSWVINPKNSPNAAAWIDWAGNFHNNGTTVGFADTHAEYHGWQDPRTAQIQWFSEVTPGNADLIWLQEIYTP